MDLLQMEILPQGLAPAVPLSLYVDICIAQQLQRHEGLNCRSKSGDASTRAEGPKCSRLDGLRTISQQHVRSLIASVQNRLALMT